MGSCCIQMCCLGVYGKGVYVVVDLVEGEILIEYVGEIIIWDEVLCCYLYEFSDLNYIFYFYIDEDYVIDVKVGGNFLCWINYSCQFNCEVEVDDGWVFIWVQCNIVVGEELFYDYGLVIDEFYILKFKVEYLCWCGVFCCCGMLLVFKWVGKVLKLG